MVLIITGWKTSQFLMWTLHKQFFLFVNPFYHFFIYRLLPPSRSHFYMVLVRSYKIWNLVFGEYFRYQLNSVREQRGHFIFSFTSSKSKQQYRNIETLNYNKKSCTENCISLISNLLNVSKVFNFGKWPLWVVQYSISYYWIIITVALMCLQL